MDCTKSIRDFLFTKIYEYHVPAQKNCKMIADISHYNVVILQVNCAMYTFATLLQMYTLQNVVIS